MARAAFRAYQVERCVGRWRKCIASDAMAIVRSHDDTAGGEMSFTAALDLPVVRAFSPTTTRHWRTWFPTMRWILFMAMNPHSWQSYDCFYLSQRRQAVTHCHKVAPSQRWRAAGRQPYWRRLTPLFMGAEIHFGIRNAIPTASKWNKQTPYLSGSVAGGTNGICVRFI